MRLSLAAAVLAASLAPAAPPVASTTDLKAEVGKPALLTLTVEKGKKLGTDKTYDPAKLMLARLWTDDSSTYEFWVFPNEAGEYRVPFWTEGDTKGTVVKVTATGGTAPKPPPVTPDPPPGTPPPAADTYYFVVIRPKQMTKGVADALALPAWTELKGKGHVYKDFAPDEVPTGVPVPASLPAVVKLRLTPKLNWEVVPGTLPLPATDDGVRGLLTQQPEPATTPTPTR